MLQVQKADAADPWYQHEWGEIMLQQGRLREAVLHLQVAATLFASHIDKVMHVSFTAAPPCTQLLCMLVQSQQWG